MAVDTSSTIAAPPAPDALPTGSCLDPLTGLPGPVFWGLVLATESARLARYGGVATIVLAEVLLPDEPPHASGAGIGDQIVITVARALRSSSRASDYTARLGRGRFGLILTGTDEIAAINFVDRARDRCERDLRASVGGLGLCFGWASPKGSMTLAEAAVRAERWLRDEAAARSR